VRIPMSETATMVEKELDKVFSDTLHEPFKIPSARIYGVTVGKSNKVVLSIVDMAEDVYEILSKPMSERKTKFTTFALVTSGWAAPLGANGEVEGAPSEHPARRRVRLAVVGNADDGVASVLRFSDEPDEPVIDPGSATGSLANAFSSFLTN
jgi:hypothetical protein